MYDERLFFFGSSVEPATNEGCANRFPPRTPHARMGWVRDFQTWEGYQSLRWGVAGRAVLLAGCGPQRAGFPWGLMYRGALGRGEAQEDEK